MAQFNYIAYNDKGREVKGKIDADTREGVADKLHGQGLTVITIDEDLAASIKRLTNFQVGGLPIKERVMFARQLSIMLSAGVPIVQALRILVGQQENTFVKEKLVAVSSQIEAGTKLSQAFEQVGLFFNEVQLNLLAAGEKSGNLNVMMNKVADDLEKSKNLRSKIRSAMIYPIIIFLVLIVVVVIVMVFMIPSVKDLYRDLGKSDLPGITQILVDMSNFFTNPVGMISTIILFAGTFFWFRYYYSTPNGRHSIDKLLLRLPIFGSLINKIQLAQFSRILAMLMQSGVPIIEGLKIVSGATGNVLYRDVILHAADEVAKGTSLSIPLAYGAVFPEIYLHIIATGEDTGKLDQVLQQMADYYTAEVDEITNNLTKLMEPIILLLVGGVVGFIAVAVYLPIYSLGQ